MAMDPKSKVGEWTDKDKEAYGVKPDSKTYAKKPLPPKSKGPSLKGKK